MKKYVLITVLSLLLSSLFAQAQREYIIHMEFDSKKDIERITRLVSIDNIQGNTIKAYASPAQLQNLQAKGYEYEVVPKPSLKDRVLNMATTVEEMADWDRYPTYDVYKEMMQQFAEDYPDICKLDTIGTSVENRLLLVVKISDNVDDEEAEAEAFYTATMHGDELAGITLHLRLIDYLLSNYGSDDEVDNMVNNMEIWINPMSNPDGTYAGGNDDVSGSTRYNANSVDLNRNFPDPEDGQNPDGNDWQPENIAMMDFAEAHNFVLSQNTHGGEEVVNYPWDTWSDLHADDDWWQYVGHQYADTVHANAPSGYMDGFNDGITNGHDWYTISGGRQDYMNYFQNCREFTLEISMVKQLSSDELPEHWTYNYRSLINYLKEATYGINGIVTNTSGEPLDAEIRISGHDVDNSYVVTDPDAGDYYRPIAAGTYTVEVSAYGYVPQTIEGVVVNQGESTGLDVALTPAATVDITGSVLDGTNGNPIADATISFENEQIDPVTTDDAGNFTVTGIMEGNYSVTITASDYAIASQTIEVTSSNTNFDFVLMPVNTISFEDGSLPDDFSTSGDANWFVTTSEAHDGTNSARSGEVGDSESTTMEFSYTYESAGNISFALKTSCEISSTYYDFLEFFIDGTSQGKWNGETGWTVVSFPVSAGEHTFTWTFERDGSVGDGENAAWVDFIQVPVAGGSSPISSLSATSMTFNLTAENLQATDSITITNIGSGTLSYTTMMSAGNWAEVTSTESDLDNGESAAITVSVDGTGLNDGAYHDTLMIAADDAYSIPVTMNIDGVGIRANQMSQTALYPNPSRGQITLKTEESLEAIQIYNASGKLIFMKKIKTNGQNQCTINASLMQGVYLLRAITDEQVSTKKLIIE